MNRLMSCIGEIEVTNTVELRYSKDELSNIYVVLENWVEPRVTHSSLYDWGKNVFFSVYSIGIKMLDA